MFADATIVAWLAGAVGMAYGIFRIFKDAEAHVSPLYKARIRRWFAPQGGDPDRGAGWTENFVELFDRVFGARILSWRFFMRSCLATPVFAALMVLIYIGLGRFTRTGLSAFLQGDVWNWHRWHWLMIVFGGNLVADYLSLIQTRLVLGWMRGRGAAARAAGVLGDALATAAIYLALAAAFYNIEALWVAPEVHSPLDHAEKVLGLDISESYALEWSKLEPTVFQVVQFVFGEVAAIPFARDHWGTLYADSYRISFVTTFFTSAWLWLFVLAGLIGRAVFVARGRLTAFGRIFDVNAVPVTALGYTVALLVLAVHLAILAAVHAGGWITGPPGA